jgi:hypothetical protein
VKIEENTAERRFTIKATGLELSMLLSVLGGRREEDAKRDGTSYELENSVHCDIDYALGGE